MHSVAFVFIALAFSLAAVVRMLPVAVSMIGMKMRSPTLLFLGWFGPRGLASIASRYRLGRGRAPVRTSSAVVWMG